MSTTRRSKTVSRKSSRRPAARKSNSVNSLENGISVLKYAIRKKKSVSASAVDNGYGRNYISDIKARLEENYKSKNITRDLYTTFKSLNKEYDRAN